MSNIEMLLTIAIIGLLIYEFFHKRSAKIQFKEDMDKMDNSISKFNKFVDTVAFHEIGFGIGEVYKDSQHHDHSNGKLKISFKEKNVDVLVVHSSKENGYGIYKIFADSGFSTKCVSWYKNAAIIWVLKGKATFKIFDDSEKLTSLSTLDPGDYINLAPGTKHTMEVDSNTAMLAIFIPPLCATVDDIKRMREEIGFEV